MINILFHILITMVLLASIIVLLLGIMWLISIELREMLDVDVLWNIKMKVRTYVYASEEQRKEIRRNLFRRTARTSRSRNRTQKRKRKIHEESKGNRTRLFKRKLNLFRIRKASNQSEQSLQQSDKKSEQETERDRG